MRPDVYVKGNEYVSSTDPRFLAESKLVRKLGGRMVYTSGEVVFSSTEIIRNYNLDTAALEKISYVCSRYQINRALLGKMTEAASSKRIMIIGEAILDEFKNCQGLGISHESPILSLALKRTSRSIGGAGVLASHFASLGAKVVFLTSFNPDSPDAAEFRRLIENRGVTMINIEDPQRGIVVKTRFVVDGSNVLKVEDGVYLPLDSELRSQLTARFKEQIEKGVDCVGLF